MKEMGGRDSDLVRSKECFQVPKYWLAATVSALLGKHVAPGRI